MYEMESEFAAKFQAEFAKLIEQCDENSGAQPRVNTIRKPNAFTP